MLRIPWYSVKNVAEKQKKMEKGNCKALCFSSKRNKLVKLIKIRRSHGKCSLKKVFLKISQIDWKKPVQKSPFTLLKRGSNTSVFSADFANILRTPSLLNTPNDYFWKTSNVGTFIHNRCVISDSVYQKKLQATLHFLSQVCKINL